MRALGEETLLVVSVETACNACKLRPSFVLVSFVIFFSIPRFSREKPETGDRAQWSLASNLFASMNFFFPFFSFFSFFLQRTANKWA